MSHLKLQKLLYYVQALHLAYFESPIIEMISKHGFMAALP
jgi:uncharacterized phage-associated protein